MTDKVIVLGGGIVGLSCAFEAAGRGYKVTVVETGKPGGQASGAAAGMLAPYSENTEQPDAFFRLCLDSLRRYPQWLEEIEEASGRRIERIPSGSLNIVYHEADLSPLRTRLLWQNRFGAEAEIVEGSRLRELEPLLSPNVEAALYCPRESHVYAPDLVSALEDACRSRGIHIADHCGAVTDVRLTSAPGVTVSTEARGDIAGDRLVVCTGAWTGALGRWFGLHFPVHPIRGQICAYELPVGVVRHMVFSPQAYWTSKGNGTLVCGASEDVAGFDTAVTEKGIGRLVRSGPKAFPFLADKPLIHRWAGLRPATRDGWPLLGQLAEAPHVVIAAGHYRNGILLSPATGASVADLLDGKADRTELAPFSPGRFTLALAGGLPV
ncbi:glycine oxidase ThiO [uncultured Paenibacillus sp.]|uniref:glycine oxidase ThiO n=1 Tax=uncultured Paenibacillus sp. TaxID=227322 RepID=UPI0028D7375B|nr:glycine oxidase ThiO [uncultured Paenibacillus sp.]